MEQVRENLLQSQAAQIAAFVSWMSQTSVIDELPLIDVPVLNIIGGRDAIVPPVHQIHLSGRLPCVHTVILDKVGHLPMAEARSKVNQLVAIFLLLGPITANRKNSLTKEASERTAPECREHHTLEQIRVSDVTAADPVPCTAGTEEEITCSVQFS